jgi:hypothetical protein
MSGRPAAVCFWNSLRRSLTNSEKTRNSANGARRVHSPVACGRDHGTAPTPGQQTGPVQILRMDQPDMVTPVWPTTVHSLSKSRLRHESTAGFGVGIVARRPEPPKTSVTRQSGPSHRKANLGDDLVRRRRRRRRRRRGPVPLCQCGIELSGTPVNRSSGRWITTRVNAIETELP